MKNTKIKLLDLFEITNCDSIGSEEYNTPNAFTDQDENEELVPDEYELVKEEIDSGDWSQLKKLIRFEIALLFFDLYKKRNVWTK